MITTPKPLTFNQFLDFAAGNELNEYELVAGRLVLMPEKCELDEEILEFLSFMFELAYRKRKLKYSVRKRNALQINERQSRRPDIAIIQRPQFYPDDQPRMGIQTQPFMIVEIASSNWSTDLIDKQEEYLVLGVPEYWIIDYRGQIPAKYCLRGKGKKAIVLTLENREYQRSEYLEGETIQCLTFPDLTLTVDQVLAADAEDVV
ncbi:Uma2 family endonuclease [Nostoc sp.]|uniref:Uma2 family endonuclease n=1 Tax=Nostoc sp. TaxID=1180 RepID=UPI002FF46C0F